MKKVISSVRGTRDFYPKEMATRNWLYSVLREVSESFGYQEWEAPFLESIELYAAKSGEELVKKQSYVFPDRGGDLITLRPELTPSLARMIAQRQRQLVYPLRWWSFGPFWRYERPAKGRSREFFQWNVDLIGVDTPEADAEIVAIIASFFARVGLTPEQVIIFVNSRQLVDSELEAIGIPLERKADISRWIDRKDKMTQENWAAYGVDMGLSKEQYSLINDLINDPDLWKKSDDLQRLFSSLDALGIQDYVRFNASTVRGLDYYTGIVFESMEASGDIRRSILGGGRYNNLMEAVGGDPLPATGFAMGDFVITLILEKYNLIPKNLESSPASIMITIFNEELLSESQALSAQLQNAGFNANCYPQITKLPKQFKYADRMGMKVVIILGPDEVANGQVTVKDLSTGSQQTILRSNIIQAVRSILETN
jgi:histidyl-tRNA synthetase